MERRRRRRGACVYAIERVLFWDEYGELKELEHDASVALREVNGGK